MVQFSEFDAVQRIPHINDFSEAQIRDCYYSKQDIRNIQAECVGIVAHTNIEGIKGGDGFNLRGLDQHTSEYKQNQSSMSRHLYDTVFTLQKYQQQTGKDVSDRMAKLCEKFAAPAVAAAQINAMSDIFSAFNGSWTKRGTPVIRDIPTLHRQPVNRQGLGLNAYVPTPHRAAVQNQNESSGHHHQLSLAI
jgi:hypothetical protein